MVATEQIVRLVRQHAKTSQLLGVDFVPAYMPGDGTNDRTTRECTPSLDVPAPSVPAPSPDSPSTGLFERVEPKPEPAAAARPAAPGNVTASDSAAALHDLRLRYEKAAPHAPFIKKFTNIVFGEGDPCARLCFVGEAPGEEEDRTGRPFVGRAGQLLDKMIQAMGLSRGQVYICNVLKVRPPDNATPTLEEAQASKPFLMEQLSIISPTVIVTLGKSASQCLLDTADSMGAMRGRWHQLRLPDARAIAVMPTFHPAYLLRSYTEENRKKVWSDLQMVMERLAGG